MNAPQPTDPLSDEEFARSKRVLETLVRTSRDQGAVPLVLTYPTFTRPEWAGIDSLREDEFKVALSYLAGGELTPAGWRRFAATTNANLRDVASRLDVPLIEAETINSPTQFHDLIHLTPAGNDALAKRVAPVLLKVDGERKASAVK
jgi:lysophospholipase L1-like esterase